MQPEIGTARLTEDKRFIPERIHTVYQTGLCAYPLDESWIIVPCSSRFPDRRYLGHVYPADEPPHVLHVAGGWFEACGCLEEYIPGIRCGTHVSNDPEGVKRLILLKAVEMGDPFECLDCKLEIRFDRVHFFSSFLGRSQAGKSVESGVDLHGVEECRISLKF